MLTFNPEVFKVWQDELNPPKLCAYTREDTNQPQHHRSAIKTYAHANQMFFVFDLKTKNPHPAL